MGYKNALRPDFSASILRKRRLTASPTIPASQAAAQLRRLRCLQGSQMLQILEKSLRKSLPESLKVYGTIFHMSQRNPFKLKALVDKWPDYNAVVVRPEEQNMTDNFGHYTNTYQIYSKDPWNCQEFLGISEVTNWKQHLQIRSSHSSLDEVIPNLASTKSIKVKRTQRILYMMPKTARTLVLSLLQAKNLPPEMRRPKPINEELFKHASLDITHPALVTRFWHFCGNESSQRLIERCIRTFPTACLLGPEGTPVSWMWMDQTGELRTGATVVPKHRAQGLISHLLYFHIQALDELGFPTSNHRDRANKFIQKMSESLQLVHLPCDWSQWNCVPVTLTLTPVRGKGPEDVTGGADR
ncbi:glycine N-phenylacetyltransferase-like [Echinops telfairi]|uniref:Glycine N-phenylacetyltransferase-like n=1 Tax=Echinops telfairi TaxID=9371 RepID=A0AC55CP41_ECHTE|nr:glycine N-phenylacetyltransferase-like [Echinops telfairi]